jgi:HAD superfamily hydrolase (TIGR01509 family)
MITALPQAIIFDLDGTLVDTVGTRVEAWLATFASFDIHPDRADIAPLIGSDGRLLVRTIAQACRVSLYPGQDAQIDAAAGEAFRVLNSDPRPLPAVIETLEALTALGLPWAVATSSLPTEATASVAALGLSTKPLVCDGAGVEHAKPAPDLLLKAARTLRVDPARTWYVGDARWDMLAARAAGMRAVGVTTGATPETGLVDAGADVVYPTLREFQRAILDD